MKKSMVVLISVLFYSWGSISLGSYKIHLSSAWYPFKKVDLLESLYKHEQLAQESYDMSLDPFKIRAIICPHAGFDYSGSVAAAAYRLLPKHYFKRIIVLAPSHHISFKGVGLPGKQYFSYKNTLGSVELDKKVLDALSIDASLCSDQAHAHELDHSINVQIPFIQYFCGKRSLLVPLLIGDVTLDQVEAIATLLRSYIDQSTLVIVSSDFTHYGKRFSYEPFKQEQNIIDHICELDSSVVAQIQDQNLRGFDQILQQTKATVCGRNPIKVLLALLEKKTLGDVETYVVGYDASALDQKNPEHSVSYVSCVLSNEQKRALSVQNYLTGYEKGLLLSIARDRVNQVALPLYNEKKGMVVSGLLTKGLRELRGAFVTLYKMGQDGYEQLRGCMGALISHESLYKTVYDMAEQAALHDSRFKPVDLKELPYLNISVSVLTDLKKISSYRDIVLDRDGVVMEYKGRSAVYLPKVAKEQGWSLEQMLSSLSQKAGFSALAWKDVGAEFKVFESCDFGEDKDPLEVMYEGYKK